MVMDLIWSFMTSSPSQAVLSALSVRKGRTTVGEFSRTKQQPLSGAPPDGYINGGIGMLREPDNHVKETLRRFFPAGLGLRRLGRGARAQLAREAVLIRGQGRGPGDRLGPPLASACHSAQSRLRSAESVRQACLLFSQKLCADFKKKGTGKGRGVKRDHGSTESCGWALDTTPDRASPHVPQR
jgi:hypothetical protein